MEEFVIKKCPFCGCDIKMGIVSLKGSPRFGQVRKQDLNKKYCSDECVTAARSERMSGDKNISCNKDIAEKISNSLKVYLQENPRLGEDNPFFGKHHSEETKTYLSESKKGIQAYDDDGYKKLLERTPKGVNHPNWKNGASILPYKKFTIKKKKEIKQLDNFKCIICGECEKLLAVHHIDYDKNNSEVDNLVTLCFSCHAKTNYNREDCQSYFENYINNDRNTDILT